MSTPSMEQISRAAVDSGYWEHEEVARALAVHDAEVRADERAKRPDREQGARALFAWDAANNPRSWKWEDLTPEQQDVWFKGFETIASALALEPEAREEPKVENLEIINGWLVERGAHPGEYPAGAAYGMLPDSDAEPLMDLSQIPGWPEAREVTDLKAKLLKLASEGSWCGECTLADDVEKLLLSAEDYAALIADREEARRTARR